MDSRSGTLATIYHTDFDNVNIYSEGSVRDNAMTRAIGVYRASHGGLGHPPNGTAFKLVYQDGSMECSLVINQTETVQDAILDGTQEAGGGGGGGGGGGHSLGYYFPPPTWLHICDTQYSDGVEVGQYCFYEVE